MNNAVKMKIYFKNCLSKYYIQKVYYIIIYTQLINIELIYYWINS